MIARKEELVSASGTGDEVLDVIVVGGSQAGLAMAWHLAQQGLRFLVLEAGPELGHTWRSRWDSLTLFTPAQYDNLPGMAFPAPADTYPTKDPVVDYLQAYAAALDLPVRLNSPVTELRRVGDTFEVRTADDEVFHARQVVVATGPFQIPFIHFWIDRVPEPLQQASHDHESLAQSLETAGFHQRLCEPGSNLEVLGPVDEGMAGEADDEGPVRDLAIAFPFALHQIFVFATRLVDLIVEAGILQVYACCIVARYRREKPFDIDRTRLRRPRHCFRRCCH